MTPAERVLWQLLRDRRLAGFKVRRQHQCGPYMLDFYYPAQRLAVEADGGPHFIAEGRDYDGARTDYLAARGIRVLRFTNYTILHQRARVLAAIATELVHSELPSPTLAPPELPN